MSQISKNQVPPNGWAFQDRDIWFTDETADALISKVAAFRAANSFPAGDPWQEIQNQICSRFPDTCLGSIPAKSTVTTAFERFKSFAGALWTHVSTGGELVSQNEANIRAVICASCHANVGTSQSRPSNCRTCGNVEDAAITALRKQILRDRKTTHDMHLKTCQICGCCNKLQVWFRPQTLGMTEENKNAYPEFCWKKNL